MWTKVWLLLGRESQLPNPGDWQMEKVGPESILMVRQKDGGVKAFFNVCQHRGNPLVDDPKGSVKRFVCRYHSWAYHARRHAELRAGQRGFSRRRSVQARAPAKNSPAKPSPVSSG